MQTVLLTLYLCPTVWAHTVVSSFMKINQNPSLRPAGASNAINTPIQSVSSPTVMCNVNGNTPASQVTTLTAGQIASVTWSQDLSGKGESLPVSHKGPCFIYIARTDTTDNLRWSKIYHAGYSTSRKKWCTDDLITLGGLLEFEVPLGIENGPHIIRAEYIALHSAQQVDGAQYYMSCMDVSIVGGKGNKPTNPVKIPSDGWIKNTDPGVKIDIYQMKDGVDYTIPGPPIENFGVGYSKIMPIGKTGPPSTGSNSSPGSGPGASAKLLQLPTLWLSLFAAYLYLC